jgi:hypothetical protein
MSFIKLGIHSKTVKGGFRAEIYSQNLISQWIHLQAGREEGVL